MLKSKKVKIFLVDDHVSVRKGYRSLLEEEPNFQIVGEAGNGKEALDLLAVNTPDVILLDIEMPIMNGYEALRDITEQFPSVKIIILSSHYGDFLTTECLLEGACAFLSKGCNIEELITAINTVNEFGKYVSAPISNTIVSTSLQKSKFNSMFKQSALSEREIDVLKLICQGKASKVIADELKLDVNTISFHRKNITRKTKLNSVASLVKYAIKHGITPIE